MRNSFFRWLTRSIERQWYTRPHWLLLLLPLTGLFRILASLRRRQQSHSAYIAPLPLVVVGNIAVGGTGKTPVIVALCHYLRAAGWRPVVISRGYGAVREHSRANHEHSRAKHDHSRVLPTGATAVEFGDEPVLIASATNCPVVVGPDRVASARLTAEQNLGDVILSDDGLQHYRLARTFEIAVIDAQRRLGNGWCIPVGPLREPVQRLQEVDAVLINGTPFTEPWLPLAITSYTALQPCYWRHVKSGRRIGVDELDLSGARAMAGIGHPERFFATLRDLGFNGATQIFPDHYLFQQEDLVGELDQRLLMTEKDAVKVQTFAGDHWWALGVVAELPAELLQRLQHAIQSQTSPV